MKKAWQLVAHDIAIDLGTANTLVTVEGKGLVVNEPSVVAINNKTKRIIAIGEKAKQMLGKTPKDIQAARPLNDGVVSDFEITEQMLNYFIGKIHKQHKVIWPRPRVIVGLPSGVTEVEQRAVEEAARSAGARRIYLIEEPMAAAIGCGLSVNDSSGSMIVDIGGGTTEVAIISLGGVAVLKSLRIAGDEMSESIMQFMRDEYNLQIGEQTAENIKMNIGAVYVHADPKTTKVRGRNLVTGLPQEIEINSDALRIPLTKQARPIIDAIKLALEEAPAELVSDIMQKGIVVAGGGALIAGLDHLIKQETKINTIIAENALTSVVEGAARVLRNLSVYRDVLLTGSKN
ncbi:rod shape-determining protein [Candidatus Saccharibacteria bacterium CPR2]|nr:rod shape-determining protein [Candidatus Saccharibacteria bacterium CPR2]